MVHVLRGFWQKSAEIWIPSQDMPLFFLKLRNFSIRSIVCSDEIDSVDSVDSVLLGLGVLDTKHSAWLIFWAIVMALFMRPLG